VRARWFQQEISIFFCTNKKTPEESSTAELKESPGIEKGNRTVHAHMQYEADDPPVSK
jgi:hypothetical protein